MKKYVKEYVQCPMCLSAKTVVEKDKQTRLEMLKCENCNANRSVLHIKAKK